MIGNSAGGNRALAAVQYMVQTPLLGPVPASIVLQSLWLDVGHPDPVLPVAEEHIGDLYQRCWVPASEILCCNQSANREESRRWPRNGAEAAQYLKEAAGLKLVVFGADGHEIAAMFVQGLVTYDEEEATFIAVAEDGHPVGELFVDEAVDYDENTDSFVIRAVQWQPAPASRFYAPALR